MYDNYWTIVSYFAISYHKLKLNKQNKWKNALSTKTQLGKYILREKVIADCLFKDLVREDYDLTGYKTIGITASNMLSKQAALKILL